MHLPVQEQFARLLFAQQQQNAAQQQLLQSMREGMAGGGVLQGARPSFGSASGNIGQLAGHVTAPTATMQVIAGAIRSSPCILSSAQLAVCACNTQLPRLQQPTVQLAL